MQVIDIPVNKLIPYINNAKIHTPDQINQIAASIIEFGFTQPLVVDKDNVVVIGHGRLLAAEKIGLKKVPVVKITDLEKNQIKALRIADNKINSNTGFDLDLLKLELSGIDNITFESMGFSESEHELFFKNDNLLESTEKEDAAPDINEEKVFIKYGDVIELGVHKLVCGDSTNEKDVAKLMNDKKADMVFTDPPYNIGYDFNNNGMVQTGQRKARFKEIKNDNMSDDQFNNFVFKVFTRLIENMKDGASYYISSKRESTQVFNMVLKQLDLHVQSWIIWVKENFNISRLDYHPKHEIITYGWKKGKAHNWYSNRSQTDVLEFKREFGASVHPTQKPVNLIEYFLNNSSRKNELILDLFGGSGSTLIACHKNSRVCRTMELDPVYCDVIIKRWCEYTQIYDIIVNEKVINWREVI